MIQRFIQRVGETPGVEDASPITLDDLLSTPRGGLLVAEGGMGKSQFLEDLKERLANKGTFVPLARFSGNQSGLASKCEDIAKADPGHTLILDGVDEAFDLAGTICECVTKLPDDIHVWIASRVCKELKAVNEAVGKRKVSRYRLLPFSQEDIKTRAREEGLVVGAVECVLREHDLWGICGNPLGCKFVLETIKRNNGRNSWTSQEIWEQGILSLCDENDSKTKPLDRNACLFSVDQIYGCASWIALNLTLSGKNAVFQGVREAACPPSALPVSVFVDSIKTSRDLIEIALRRGVFAPWGGDCIGFAHATYRDYLAATAFQKHVPRGQWESLLLDQESRCLFAQRTGIAQWLMADDAALADQVFALSPESILTRDLTRLKTRGLCRALLDRAESVLALAWGSGRSWNVLKSQATLEALRAFNASPDSHGSRWAVELALDIARDCEYWELLADFALDDAKDDARRQDAVFALSRCPDFEIKRRLRPLLDRLADKSDRWRGSLLLVCWPDVLSIDEVLPFVARPRSMSSVETSGYRSFLSYSFFGPLLERLDPAVSSKPLAWANTWLEEAHGNFVVDEVKGGARAVYTRFWNHAAAGGTDFLVSLLADGYLAANKHYESPFFPGGDAELFGNHPRPTECTWSRDAFAGQNELRFAVLREIITRRALESTAGVDFGADGSLIQNEDDLIRVAEIILASPFDENAEQWGRVLRYTWSRHFLETQGEIVDRVHVARPDLFPKTCGEILAEGVCYRKERDAKESQHKAVMEKAAAERAAWQQQVDRDIKDALATDGTPPEQFAGIFAHLYTVDGNFKGWGELDLRQAAGWTKLTAEEQVQMIRLAERFLREATPPDDADKRGSDLAWHRALLTLKRVKPDVYEKLPEALWRKCAVELLRFHVNDTCRELYDDLERNFPAVAHEALIRCLPHEYGVSVLNVWGERLSGAQAEVVWDALFSSGACEAENTQPVRCFSEFPSINHTPFETPICDQVLSCLAQYQPDVLRGHVNERLKDGFAFQLGHPFYDVLRRYALQLDADKYFPAFLQTLEDHSDWGRRWLETPAIASEWNDLGGFRTAFFSRSAEEIGKVYEWLDCEYPPEKCPRRESGDIAASKLDRIYGFKGRLFTVLVESGKKGSAQVIEKLLANNPEGFMGHVATAQRNEAAARLPVLPADRILELTDEKKAVIASVHDLQKYVLSLLKDYKYQLKGRHPAVNDLWNTSKPVSPKSEEEVSDHLVRFLSNKITGAIFANREVQISHKLAKDGETGTRTDIWIDCETICQEKVSLCIEVKCSWNPSAKTAIADQLVAKYMSHGRADAGILLLAWFHCAAWKTEKKSVWPSLGKAKEDLEQQAKAKSVEIGKPVDAFVLDCML